MVFSTIEFTVPLSPADITHRRGNNIGVSVAELTVKLLSLPVLGDLVLTHDPSTSDFPRDMTSSTPSFFEVLPE